MTFSRRNGSLGPSVFPVTRIAPKRQVRRAHIDRFPSGKPVRPPAGASR